MVRPVTEKRTSAAFGVKPQGAQVKLEVNAPLNVRAAPSSADALARVLGIVAEPVMQWASGKATEQGRADATAGFADAALGKIDPSRYQDSNSVPQGAVEKAKAGVKNVLGGYRNRTYTDSVDRFEAVRAFQGAANAVSEWVNTEGKLLPPGQFEVELDKRMKAELGDDFANDPKQAEEIAKRYAPFMANIVAQHRSENVAAQMERNLETATTDVYGRLLQGTPVDLGAEVNDLANVLGDRSKAMQEIVGAYQRAAIEAARTGDPLNAKDRGNAILAMLDGELTGDDGSPLPGPGKSKLHAKSMQDTRDEIARIDGDRNKAARAVETLKIKAAYEDRITAHEPVGLDELIPDVQNGWLTDSEALSIYRRADDEFAKNQIQRGRTSYLLENKDRSWAEIAGSEGPDGKKITQADFEASLKEIVESYPPEQQFAIAMDWSARTGLAYLPLKNRLKNVSDTADPKDLMALHDEYLQVKGSGVADIYVDDDTAMKFERLSDLKDLRLDDKTIQAELRRDPKEAEAYIKAYGKDLKAAMDDTDVFKLHPGEDDLLNSPYVQRQLDNLATMAMGNGQSPERAAQSAKERFEQTHMPIETPHGTMILPKVAGVSQDAMEWAYNDMLPEYATRKGLDVEKLRFTPIGPNGEMILTDDMGLRVTPEVFSPTMISQKYDKMKRDSAIEQFKDTAEMERLKRTDPAGFKTMERRAAIERARKRDEDMRLYAEKRAKAVMGGVDNLASSTFDFNIASKAGGTKRHINRRVEMKNAAADTSVVANAHDDIPSAQLEASPVMLVEHTLAVAESEGLPTDLVRGIVQMESSGGKHLRNRKSSARGPMHILRGTFQHINDTEFGGALDWNDVRDQTKASVRYLKKQVDRFGSPDVAVLAYFLGEGRVSELLAQHDGNVEAFLDAKIKNNATPRQYLETVRRYAAI